MRGRWGQAANARFASRPADPEPGPGRWGEKAQTAGRFGRKASGAAAKTGRFLWDSGPDWKK